MKFMAVRFFCVAGAVAGYFFCAFGLPGQTNLPIRSVGEPYELKSRKLIFATWRYVRPGGFAWINKQGENVTVGGAEDAWGASLQKRDHPFGIRIAAQPAVRHGILIKPEKPWETGGITVSTILRDEGKFKAWGGSKDAKGQKYNCYFESDDGVSWRRPELGLVQYEGNKRNNLIAFSSAVVFKDPSAPPAERYKSVDLGSISKMQFEEYKKKRPNDWHPSAVRNDVGHVYSIEGSISPDGLNWTKLPEPLVVEHSDTQIVAYYDTARGKYVMFTRNYNVQSRAFEPGDKEQVVWWGGDAYGIGRRSIGRTESSDFRRFPVSKVVLEPGPERAPDDFFYTNCKTEIPGTDQGILFPAIWHTSNDSTSIEIAVGDDGVNWHFPANPIVLDTANFGEWDGGCIFAQPNLIELPNGDFALPYQGYNFPHKYPRGQLKAASGLAKWPKGRILAIEAESKGEFATAIFLCPGKKLRVNALTKRGGSIFIEVADGQGAPITRHVFADAAPITGDQPDFATKWAGSDDLGVEKGHPMLLRFRLDQAKLFSLSFED